MPRVWFHLIASTYGSWLPGDPRGFRTWNHKEHIEGDYKHPPPAGLYDERHQSSKRLQKSSTVILPPDFRPIVGNAVLEQFAAEEGRVLATAVSGQHVHLQVQLEDCDARLPMGRAKLHAWHAIRKLEWKKKLWAVRCKVVRIGDREHQRNVYYYILGHREEGAWVWSELENESTEGMEPLGF